MASANQPDEDEPEYCPGCDGPGPRPSMCLHCGAHFAPYMEDDFGDGDRGEWECCWHCGGAGGFHDCGEDCCPCAEPELNEPCPECHGNRGWYT